MSWQDVVEDSPVEVIRKASAAAVDVQMRVTDQQEGYRLLAVGRRYGGIGWYVVSGFIILVILTYAAEAVGAAGGTLALVEDDALALVGIAALIGIPYWRYRSRPRDWIEVVVQKTASGGSSVRIAILGLAQSSRAQAVLTAHLVLKR